MAAQKMIMRFLTCCAIAWGADCVELIQRSRLLLLRHRRCLLCQFLIPAPGNTHEKRLKLRLAGSARKLQKRFQDTPKFKFPAVSVRIERFQRSNGRSERGDHPV
jgi:hypothetical protein